MLWPDGRHFLSHLLKSLWLFFPSILFLLFPIFCFWELGQGKDIVVAFTENEARTILGLYYTRIVFFLAIGFWVYVSWYSSRIIAYIKKSKQADTVRQVSNVRKETVEEYYHENKGFFELSLAFLEGFPRYIGSACFLVLELAVWQSPLLSNPLSDNAAWIIFIIASIIFIFIGKWVHKRNDKPIFRTVFRVLFILLIGLIILVSLFHKINILVLFVLLVLFHVVFLFYINLRRAIIESEKEATRIHVENQTKEEITLLEKIMDYFCIPRVESGYFKFFLYMGLIGITFYLLCINWLAFARGIGPFPFIILGISVLLSFGNIVTAFSVRFRVNFHFILFLMALLFGLRETHYVRTKTPPNGNNYYAQRPSLDKYLRAWMKEKHLEKDSSGKGFDIYFVMANGGASRSGYWTASVLGKIEDSSLILNSNDRFSNHIFCLSGTSGGGVGVATFFSLLRDKILKTKPIYSSSAIDYLKQDYFTYTFARMLGPDYFNYIFHVSSFGDRAAALEHSFEISSRNYDSSLYKVPFHDLFSSFPAMKDTNISMPILCINTTRMQDGNPGVVTNLKLDSGIFNNRVDVLGLLGKDSDISITSASILGARFPYLSPAGRIANDYFVDGGYFDNSGAGVVQEMIRGIINIGRNDSLAGGNFYKQLNKLHFKVLHIVNSPIDLDSANIKAVPPIKNDLMAPVLTIVGAYDMQTTVNDGRLVNYLNDINKYTQNRADYIRISLYKGRKEWANDSLHKTDPIRYAKEPPYAMNWFMSDTTLRRINNRLTNNDSLNKMIRVMNKL